MGARGKREAFSKRLWKTPLHVCTCSQPFPKHLSPPEFPGVFHNRGSVHRPCPPTQIRSPETTGEPFLNVTRLFDWNGPHELKFGTQNSLGDWAEVASLNGDIVLRFRDGRVRFRGAPKYASRRAQPPHGARLLPADRWTIGNRLTINAGLRYDKFRINIAEQSAPAGTWVPARQFDEIKNVPNWDDLMPRLVPVLKPVRD